MLTLPLTSVHRDEIQGVGPFGRSCSELARSTLTKSLFFTNTVPTSRGALRAESVLALASFTQSGMAIRKQGGVSFGGRVGSVPALGCTHSWGYPNAEEGGMASYYGARMVIH